MKNQGIRLSAEDVSNLSYLVNQITGKEGASDTTELLWQKGSVHGTIPATPEHLRGVELFKYLKHLPPVPSYNGSMKIHRQGGEVTAVTI